VFVRAFKMSDCADHVGWSSVVVDGSSGPLWGEEDLVRQVPQRIISPKPLASGGMPLEVASINRA
jgi:hypothetical protein